MSVNRYSPIYCAPQSYVWASLKVVVMSCLQETDKLSAEKQNLKSRPAKRSIYWKSEPPSPRTSSQEYTHFFWTGVLTHLSFGPLKILERPCKTKRSPGSQKFWWTSIFLMIWILKGGSGKSTVVKQMRILHGDQGLTPADRQVFRIIIFVYSLLAPSGALIVTVVYYT